MISVSFLCSYVYYPHEQGNNKSVVTCRDKEKSRIAFCAVFEGDISTELNTIESAPTKAQKVIRNGQVLIIRADKTFNALGTEIK